MLFLIGFGHKAQALRTKHRASGIPMSPNPGGVPELRHELLNYSSRSTLHVTPSAFGAVMDVLRTRR
jgi:hypothetical protein